jgi:hypothetical protein
VVPVLIVVGSIAVVAAGWFGYTAFRSATPVDDTLIMENSNQIVDEPINTNSNSNAPVNSVNADAVVNAPSVYVPPVDTDLDGLTDEDEKVWGTNPAVVDTDADGLTDRQEVISYATDPTNPDTDGDTYSDGSEVANGYSPKGDGPLFRIDTPGRE